MARVLWLLLACCMATSAVAQITPLEIGKPYALSGTVGSGGDLLSFVGLTGDKVQVRLSSEKGATVSVVGPGGERLGTVTGKGAHSMTLLLSANGVYFIAATVWESGPYTLEVQRLFTAPPPGPPPVDPNWGLYSRLPGQVRIGQKGGYTSGYVLSWRWEREGEVLVEEWRYQDKSIFIGRITRGVAPGELLLTGNKLGNKQWKGTVAADGSVYWEGIKGFKFRYQVSMGDDDRMHVEYLDRSGPARNLWYLPPAE